MNFSIALLASASHLHAQLAATVACVVLILLGGISLNCC
jgi:hypothetical protein